MAFQRKKALAILSTLAYPLALHVLYGLLFPKVEVRPEWLAEIRGLCNRIHLLTILKQGRLKEQDLMKALYEEPIGRSSLHALVDIAFEQEPLASPVSREDGLAQAKALRQKLLPLYRELIGQLLQPVGQYRANQCLQAIQAHWDGVVRRS